MYQTKLSKIHQLLEEIQYMSLFTGKDCQIKGRILTFQGTLYYIYINLWYMNSSLHMTMQESDPRSMHPFVPGIILTHGNTRPDPTPNPGFVCVDILLATPIITYTPRYL